MRPFSVTISPLPPDESANTGFKRPNDAMSHLRIMYVNPFVRAILSGALIAGLEKS